MPCPVQVMIATWQWGAYLGEDAVLQGARLITSAWVRLPANAMPGKAKAGGNYVNSALARMDAVSAGFDEALLLDQNGFVAEGSGENIFFVRDGRLHVIASSVNLVGITRASVLEIAREMGLEIQEVMATRDQLYTADEVFMTGTAAEVTPVSEIDYRPIGSGRAGPVSLELRRRYLRGGRGAGRALRPLADLRQRLAPSEHPGQPGHQSRHQPPNHEQSRRAAHGLPAAVPAPGPAPQPGRAAGLLRRRPLGGRHDRLRRRPHRSRRLRGRDAHRTRATPALPSLGRRPPGRLPHLPQGPPDGPHRRCHRRGLPPPRPGHPALHHRGHGGGHRGLGQAARRAGAGDRRRARAGALSGRAPAGGGPGDGDQRRPEPAGRPRGAGDDHRR